MPFEKPDDLVVGMSNISEDSTIEECVDYLKVAFERTAWHEEDYAEMIKSFLAQFGKVDEGIEIDIDNNHNYNDNDSELKYGGPVSHESAVSVIINGRKRQIAVLEHWIGEEPLVKEGEDLREWLNDLIPRSADEKIDEETDEETEREAVIDRSARDAVAEEVAAENRLADAATVERVKLELASRWTPEQIQERDRVERLQREHDAGIAARAAARVRLDARAAEEALVEQNKPWWKKMFKM